ncbi:MAG: amino acid ABC transporter permease [Rhodospirillales bacterium]|nr:amino acid ABC transporter permease [Rhodospirillales bacterium]
MQRTLAYGLLMIRAAGTTLEVSVLALLLAVIVGLVVGMIGTSGWKPAELLTRLYVELVRSVPLLVLVFFAYYAVPLATSLTVSPYMAATGALAVYGGAYMAEVVRSGIRSVGRGQWEAARALGLGYAGIMRLVVLPQAIRVMVPAGIGVFINLIKDSSVTSIIGFVELTQTAINIRNTVFSLDPIFFAGLLYFFICFGLSRAGRSIELRVRGREGG